MSLTKIGPKHQVTIPKEIFEQLRLEVGDHLEVQAMEHTIVLVPQRLVPKEQEWFYTKEWQEKEREADHAILRGEISRPFKTVEALMRHLRGNNTPRKKSRE